MHLLRVVDGASPIRISAPTAPRAIAEETEGLALVLAVPSVFRRLTQEHRGERPGARCPHPAEEDRFCGVCGTTLTDLKESGMVGCPNCYQVFAEYLQTALEGDTKPVEHLGKMPRRGPETDTLRHEIMRLERMLRELVECERFEEAAGVRDRLTELGQRLEEGPS